MCEDISEAKKLVKELTLLNLSNPDKHRNAISYIIGYNQADKEFINKFREAFDSFTSM